MSMHHCSGGASRRGLTGFAAALLLSCTPLAHAEPILQLYVEGGTYDPGTESWVLSPDGSSAGAPFRLWTIGNLHQGPILDVRLAANYDRSWGQLQIDLTPTRIDASDYPGWLDPSTPFTPVFLQYRTDGSVPVLGAYRQAGLDDDDVTGLGDLQAPKKGKSLPQHGEYGSSTAWQEFYLGDFDTADSPLADFISSFPSPNKANAAQINVYDVVIRGAGGGSAHGAEVRFDLYDHVQSKNKARTVFAPFSHDVGVTSNIVPAPSTAVASVFGLGLLGLVALGRRRRDGDLA